MTDIDDPGSWAMMLREYQEKKPELERVASRLKTKISALARQVDLDPMIVSRVLSIDEFSDLVYMFSQDDSLPASPPLCLVEIAVHTRDQVPILVRVLENNLELEAGESNLLAGGHEASRRFTLHFAARRGGEKIEAELQIRTLIGFAWAQIYRDLARRNEWRLPQIWRSELATLDARLQSCDWSLEAISEAIGTYGNTYSAYLSRTELEALTLRLEAVLETDPQNIAAVQRLIQIYKALDNDDARVQSIYQQHRSRLKTSAATLRDVGTAACRTHEPDSKLFRAGQTLIEKAIRLDPSDVMALCELGRSERAQGQRTKAVAHFKAACSLDPTDPKALKNCIIEAMMQISDKEAADAYRAMIPLASDRCLTQARNGVNLPWAYLDLGFFHLLEERPLVSLGAFATGVQFAQRGWMLHAARQLISDFSQRNITLPSLDSIGWLLDLGVWIKTTGEKQTSLHWKPPVTQQDFRKQCLVLAGSGSWEGDLDSPLVVLKTALQSFEGLLVAGGARSGVHAVAGDLQEQLGNQKLQTIGYLRSGGASPDARYSQIRSIDENAPLGAEALTFWQDFAASGNDPSCVRIICVGGDTTTQCELQIAMAFGARVAILEGSSGPAGEDLWRDMDAHYDPSRDNDQLVRLELSSDEITHFVEE